MLSTVIDGERIPLAGVPWFVAPFGREMTFVGLETLLLDLRWSQAAVSFLARRQGTHDSAFRDEQPGKIMHELRRGELADLRAIPHTPYFGSVDATPLWLLLVAELAIWTGDLDGFEMRPRPSTPPSAGSTAPATPTATGSSSTSAARGSVSATRAGATPPTPSCTPTARRSQAPSPWPRRRATCTTRSAASPPSTGSSATWSAPSGSRRGAARLKRAFNDRFWMEDEDYFAMALDGEKRQVRPVCSTIGHALWSRIVADEHVPAVVKRLMAPDMFTGWGVRTISKVSGLYNPVSFYNGSVWPFDTALIANGMKKHGYAQESNRLAWGLVEAAAAHEYSRLPEMFCGFTRQSIDRPVSFPMACSPDANSSAALFLVLQSMLGIYAQAEENIVYVHNPVLPKWLGEVTLSNLRVGRTTMRLRFRREGGHTSFSVLDKQGPGRIVVVE